MINTHNLPQDLAKIRDEIKGYATDMGLEFFNTIFQIVDYEEMSSIAAYTGFPNRYPHWKFGMEYNQLKQTRRFGLGTIFEMVINNNPVYAYLLDCNSPVQQKLVMAHVYGHADFITSNYMFLHTNRKMMDQMANNATKIRRYVDLHGIDKVESFLDTVLSLETLIDPSAPFKAAERKKYEKEGPAKLPVDRSYMDSYVNPPKKLKKTKDEEAKERMKMLSLVNEPERDVLNFLIKHAPLTDWQRTIIDIIREESYYFAPQAQTKILNEGWACYCHEQIMTKKVLNSSEIVEFADWHSRVASPTPGGLNPYALGLALLRSIEDRWNKGRHGKEYDECDDIQKKRDWNTHENKGLEKLFEVRKQYDDISFIQEFFTQEFVTEQKLFTYERYDEGDHYEYFVESKKVEEVKQQLLFQKTNLGLPFIFLTDGNYGNKGELLLQHRWEGTQLDIDYAQRTLINLEKIWRRPVNLVTFAKDEDKPDEEEKEVIIRCEKGKTKTTELKEENKPKSLIYWGPY